MAEWMRAKGYEPVDQEEFPVMSDYGTIVLMRRALAIDEQSYGAAHPDVAIDLNNLALLLQATNRLSESEPLARRAVEIFQKSLGDQHPNTIIVRENHASILSELQDQ